MHKRFQSVSEGFCVFLFHDEDDDNGGGFGLWLVGFVVFYGGGVGSKTHTSHTEIKKGKKIIYIYIYIYGWGWLNSRALVTAMWGVKTGSGECGRLCHVLTHPRGHWAEKKSDQKKKKTVSEWQNLMLRYIPIRFLSAYLRIQCIARAKTLTPSLSEQTDKSWISRICIQISEWQVACSRHAERQSVHWSFPLLFCGTLLFVA